jgi:hypothetical protein
MAVGSKEVWWFGHLPTSNLAAKFSLRVTLTPGDVVIGSFGKELILQDEKRQSDMDLFLGFYLHR